MSAVVTLDEETLRQATQTKYSDDQPRADDGKWTSGGGSGGGGSGDTPGRTPLGPIPTGSPTSNPKDQNYYNPADGKYHVEGDVDAAVRLIGEGQDVVLEQPREISTLIDRLAAIGKSGEKKVYDLCRVSVSGTNLFCAESAGYKRVDMPQLSGAYTPGSPASELPKDSKGGVDATPQFIESLRDKGYKVEGTHEDAGYLRATQRELDGAKVAGMMKAIQEGKIPDAVLVVSKDNYIIDGHHRWAAQVALGYSAQITMSMPIVRVDIPVVPLVEEAKKFANSFGIPQRGVGKSFACSGGACDVPKRNAVHLDADTLRQVHEAGVVYVKKNSSVVVRLDPDSLRRATRRGVVYVAKRDYVRDEQGQFAETGGGGMRASDFEGTGHNSVAENSMDKVGELIEEAGGGILANYESEQAAAAKAFVAESLSSRLANNSDWKQYLSLMHASGAGDQKVSALVHRWAMSSSDTSEESLLLQAMVAEEFGLTDYRDAGLNGGGPNSLFDPMNVDSVADQVVRNSLGAISGGAAARETVKNGYRAFVREMYKQTQDDLATEGITSAYLVRGVATDHPLGASEITLHPMSSFSTDVNTAQNFAGSTAIVAKVPASQIISTPRTGFGCLHEHEVVVLGGTIKAVVLDRHLTHDWSNHVAAALRETEEFAAAREPEKPKKAATVKDAPIQVDGTLADADWTKTAWDLPPYKSPEFMLLVPDLVVFRTLPVYHHAVQSGLITNDEWTGNPDITMSVSDIADLLRSVQKYDPNQPRDELGRFGETGTSISDGSEDFSEGGGSAADAPSTTVRDPSEQNGVLVPVPAFAVAAAEKKLTKEGYSPEHMNARMDALMDYAKANPDIWNEGMIWYAREHEFAKELAARGNLTDDQGSAVLAAVSPRQEVALTEDQALAIVEATNRDGSLEITEQLIQANYDRQIELANGKPKMIAFAERERDRALHNDIGTHDVVTGDAATVARWHSDRRAILANNWEKGLRIARGELPEEVLGGQKVWSFYDNIRNPEGSGSVTIDAWMIKALTDDDITEDDSIKLIGKAEGRQASGRYEVMSRRVRETAQRYNVTPLQAQAIAWTAYRAQNIERAESLAAYRLSELDEP